MNGVAERLYLTIAIAACLAHPLPPSGAKRLARTLLLLMLHVKALTIGPERVREDRIGTAGSLWIQVSGIRCLR